MTPSPPSGTIGQRLLPTLVDEIAAKDPGRILYCVCKTKSPVNGFQDITFREFAQAVDRCAWHIHDALGPGDKFPTLAYIGPQDATYAILVLASVKAGYKLLLNSPRNPLAAHLSLFETTECNTFLLPPKFPLPVVKEILASRTMKVLEIPSWTHWIQDAPHKPYPYNKIFSEARLEPFVVLHTSGSTGAPKPITQTHGTQAPLDSFKLLPDQGLPPTYPAMCSGKRVYLAFPLFHCAGVSMLLPGAIYNHFTVVLGPFPPSPEVADAIHTYGMVEHSCLAPMTLIDLAKNPHHLNNLSRLEQITYGGGPCPPAVGDLISKKTRLLNCLGTTECGILPVQLCEPKDWSYMTVSSALGHEYRPVADSLYEQVIVRRPELDLYQGIFCTFPELQEWPMKDMYTRHPDPTKKSYWLYKGRTDDIIVYSTGEKLNPVDMESIIGADSQVTEALIAGHGRIQSSLLVECVKPPTDEQGAVSLLSAIWPSIQAANNAGPSHARIDRDMVVFSSPEKPMLRAGKGTVQRKATIALYEVELAALYDNAVSARTHGFASNIDRLAQSEKFDLTQSLKNVLAISTDIDIVKLNEGADLFEHGLDSLQVLAITKQVNKLLTAHGRPAKLEPKTIYANSSLSGFIATVSSLFQDNSSIQNKKHITVSDLYERFATEIPVSVRQAEVLGAQRFVVLLTGATGSLGSYILDSLVKDDRILHIYCLSRGLNSKARLQEILLKKGLAPLSDNKITALDADLARPYFGLPKHDYTNLLSKVTTIIHNAWQVDFNLYLNSFTNQIVGVRRIVEFCTHSRFGAKLFFISSISTVANAESPVKEQIYRDAASNTGYSMSKLVAELLIDDATKQAGVSSTICRVGQISGPVMSTGVWPEKEWFPSLIASSRYLNKIPAHLGRMETVDWIPVDILGNIIREVATSTPPAEATGANIVHIVNPTQTTWSSLLPALKAIIGTVDTVSLQAWVDALRQSGVQAENATENPAVKLYDFYNGLASETEKVRIVETTAAVKSSPTLATLEAINADWIKSWLVVGN